MDRYIQVPSLTFLNLAIASCVPHNAAADAVLPRIDRSTWSAVETAPDRFVVVLKNSTAEREAIGELCLQHKFVCLGPEAGGRVVIIERRQEPCEGGRDRQAVGGHPWIC